MITVVICKICDVYLQHVLHNLKDKLCKIFAILIIFTNKFKKETYMFETAWPFYYAKNYFKQIKHF